MLNFLKDRYPVIRELKSAISLTSRGSFNKGCLKGSIVDPVIFDIFLCNMFLRITTVDITSYANYNTPYNVSKNTVNLQKASIQHFKYFRENGLKADQDKCDFLSSLSISSTFSPPVSLL